MSQDNRPPYETFKGPTCRGSLIFGTACGHCEKCDWERARLAGRTPTNPPVPATPLDVEACVRLLPIIAAWHKAAVHGVPESKLRDFHEGVIAMADALASALPGMGKDSEENERLREIATTGIAWLQDLRPVLHVGGTYGNAMCDEFTSPTDLHVKALLRFSAYLAARAAQPKETSADEV